MAGEWSVAVALVRLGSSERLLLRNAIVGRQAGFRRTGPLSSGGRSGRARLARTGASLIGAVPKANARSDASGVATKSSGLEAAADRVRGDGLDQLRAGAPQRVNVGQTSTMRPERTTCSAPK